MGPVCTCLRSNASGIVVSATIASTAPTATAVTVALTAGETPPRAGYPIIAASPLSTAMPVHTPKT